MQDHLLLCMELLIKTKIIPNNNHWKFGIRNDNVNRVISVAAKIIETGIFNRNERDMFSIKSFNIYWFKLKLIKFVWRQRSLTIHILAWKNNISSTICHEFFIYIVTTYYRIKNWKAWPLLTWILRRVFKPLYFILKPITNFIYI